MKKKISAILAGAVAFACLPLQAYASENAEWIEAYPDWCSDFDFDNYQQILLSLVHIILVIVQRLMNIL